MKTSTTFSKVCTGWMEIFRSMIPGGSAAAPAADLTPKAAQVVADQEWEDEGGSIKPAKKAQPAPVPKIPF